MSPQTIIIIVIVLIPISVLYSMYVSLVKKKNKVLEAFASIDVQLKKRYDLIPNIIRIAKQYMEHEKTVLEDITNIRSKLMTFSDKYKNVSQKAVLDNELAQKMASIMLAVENYPQLKANETMIMAMQTYNEVEEHIAAARRFYNSAVNELKNAVEIFPSSIIAKLVGIKALDFFKAQEPERAAVNAAEFLNK